MNARDIMSTPVVSVTPDTTVRQIAALLLQHGVSGFPVLDGDRVVGIVSEGDLLPHHELGTRRDRAGRSWWERLFLGLAGPAEYVKSHAVRAADVMNTTVISVTEDTPVARIAGLFEERGIKRVPVLRGESLVGIVTRADLVRVLAIAPARPAPLAPSDDRIRGALLAELGAHDWWRWSSRVIVADGIVHFWGVYDSEDAKRAARVAAENIPGVRRVEDHRLNGVDHPLMG